MEFIVTAWDGTDADAPARRAAARQAHLASAEAMARAGTLRYATAILNEIDQMIGSVMVVDFRSKHELDAWLENEPYVTGNVWATIDTRPCRSAPIFQPRQS